MTLCFFFAVGLAGMEKFPMVALLLYASTTVLLFFSFGLREDSCRWLCQLLTVVNITQHHLRSSHYTSGSQELSL